MNYTNAARRIGLTYLIPLGILAQGVDIIGTSTGIVYRYSIEREFNPYVRAGLMVNPLLTWIVKLLVGVLVMYVFYCFLHSKNEKQVVFTYCVMVTIECMTIYGGLSWWMPV